MEWVCELRADVYRGPAVLKSLSVTLRYCSSAFRSTLRGLALALLLNRHVRGIALYRTAFYLPMVLGGVAIPCCGCGCSVRARA